MMNIMQALQMIQQFKNNPQQILMNYGIPKEFTDSPQNVAQYLMQSGKVNQAQFEQASNMYKQLFNR